MEELDMDCNLEDEDYSSTKQSGGKITWIIDKGIWLGKKAVITGAVISSAPLVLPPLVVFSTLGFACSVPFGFVFATYACTQKIMSKLLPTPESSYVLEYEDELYYGEDELYDGDDSMEGVGGRGYDVDNNDVLVQGVGELGYEGDDNDDLVQGMGEQEYEVDDDDDDLVQGVEEQGYEKDGLIEEIMIEELVKEAVKDAQADVNKEIDDLQLPIEHWEVDIKINEQEKQFDTIRPSVTGIELDGRDDSLPEGAALLQEDVLSGKNSIDIYIKKPLEEEILVADVVEGVGLKTELDDNATHCVEIHQPKLVREEEELEMFMEGGDGAVEMNVNDSTDLEVEDTILAQVDDANKGVDQVKLALDVLQEVGMIAKLDESATDSSDFDHKQKSKTKEEQSEEVLEGDLGMSELNAIDSSEHEGSDTSWAPVVDVQKGFEKHYEEPLEQDEKVLDMLQGVRMITELDENETDSGDFHKQKSKTKEEHSEEVMEGGVGTSELNAIDSSEHERGDTIWAPVDDRQKGFKKHNEEPLEQNVQVPELQQMVHMKNELKENATDSVDIQKTEAVSEDEQLKEIVEGGGTMMELKNAYVVLKEEVVPLDGGMLMRNAIDEEAKSLTQGKSILQADADNEPNSVEKHGERPTGHSHEGSYKEDVTKPLQGEDILPLDKTEVKKKKLIIEDKNDEPVTEMQRVIVRVQGGNNIVREQESKDIKEWNKADKLVLVTRHVTEETAGKNKKLFMEDKNEEPVIEMQRVIARVQGGKNIVPEQESKENKEWNKSEKLVLVTRHVTEETAGNMYKEELVGGKRGLLDNIRDEPKSGLALELGELLDSTVERRKILNAPHTSCEGKIMVNKGKGDSSMRSEISTNIYKEPIEKKVDPEDYVGPKNIWSDLNLAREIADECGLDLLDYTAGNHNFYNDFSIPRENNNTRSRKNDDIANLPVLRVSTRVAEAKHVDYLPEADPVTPYREELLDDDKIWEQIDALRIIVGYSAPRHTTSVEEIKALYIFTGVEPPPLFADDSDIVDVNEKLRLLKTVVGVK